MLKDLVELLMCTEDIPPRCSRMRLEVANIWRNWPSFSTSTCRVQQLGWPAAQGRMWESFRSVDRTVTCYFRLVLHYHYILHFLILPICFYVLFNCDALNSAYLNVSHQFSWLICGFVKIAAIIMIVLKASLRNPSVFLHYLPLFYIAFCFLSI